jgi:hypothetical protein
MKVEYKKIYTREKYPNFNILRDLCKRDNSAKDMNKNTTLTHVLYIRGLVLLVKDIEKDIEHYI